MRSSELITSLSHTVTSQRNSESPGSRVFTVSNVYATWLDRSDIVRTPVVSGFRAPLPYSATGANNGYGFLSLGATWLSGGNTYKSSAIGTTANMTYGFYRSPDPLQLISQSSKDRLVIKLLNDVANQKWSAGQMIAEAQQAIDMIGGSAQKLARAMTFASRRRWDKVATELGVNPPKLGKAAKNPASGWLAFHFGWAPVVDDIANAALFLGGHLDRDALVIMARGALKEERSVPSGFASDFSITTNGTLPNQDINYGVRYVDNYHFTDEYKASLYYKIDDGFLRDMTKYGLVGLSTPWAIVPWSFLIDWVVPIGDFLSAMEATVGLTYLGGSYTTFRKSTCKRKTTEFFGFPFSPSVSGHVEWVPADRFVMNRSVWKNSPLPFPAYIKNPLSPWKAVTSIALLAQVKLK